MMELLGLSRNGLYKVPGTNDSYLPLVPDINVVNLSILEKFQNSFSPNFIGI